MTYTMKSYNGKRVEGRDYSKPARQIIQEAMGDKVMRIKTIAKAIGRDRESTNRIIKKMHEEGLVHISRWRRGKVGPISACYKFGAGEDAKRLAAITDAEKCARYRNSEHGKARIKAHKKTDRFRERKEALSKAEYSRKKFERIGVHGIDPLMAAIYGISAHR